MAATLGLAVVLAPLCLGILHAAAPADGGREPVYREPVYHEPVYHEPAYHEPTYHDPSDGRPTRLASPRRRPSVQSGRARAAAPSVAQQQDLARALDAARERAVAEGVYGYEQSWMTQHLPAGAATGPGAPR